MPTLPEVARAARWLGLYGLLVLFPLLLLLLDPASFGDSLGDELGSAFGFLALSIMAVQFVLTARFQWLAPPFGTDLVYAFHRHVTWVALAFALLHPLLSLGGPLADLILPWRLPWEVGAGVTALWALLILSAAAFLRRRLRLPYEGWRRWHGLLGAAAVLLGLWHAVASGRLLAGPVARIAVVGWTLLWVGLLVRVRVARPLVLRGHPWRVAAVRHEPNGVACLTFEPEGHAGFRFRSGQFVWLTLGSSPFAACEHPFSIASSSQAAPRVELAVKAVGDFTRGLLETKVGERAYLDGPYGSLSIDSFPDADGYLFVAGGVGLAPCLSMLRTLADRGDRRHHLLVYATWGWEQTPFREELAALRGRLDLEVVHVLEEPPPGWIGERGRVTEGLLARYLPPRGRHVAFVCGPGPMMDVVEGALARLGVPLADLHAERFDLV